MRRRLIAVGSATIAHDSANVLDIQAMGTHVVVRGFAIIGVENGLGELWGGGVRVDNASAAIYDCRIGPSGTIGVKSIGVASLRLERNVIRGNVNGGIRLDGLGDYQVYNNVIVDNGDFGGVLIRESSAASRFANNTIADNRAVLTGPGAVECEWSATLEGSIFWNNAGNTPSGVSSMCTVNYSILQSAPATGNNNRFQPPMFRDADYHLDPSSPAIDNANPAGTFLSGGPAPLDDFDGNTRPLGAAVDIGADEAR